MFYDLTTKYIDIFVEQIMREAFALRKLLTFFQQKKNGNFQILAFDETWNKEVVNFEQPDSDFYLALL